MHSSPISLYVTTINLRRIDDDNDIIITTTTTIVVDVIVVLYRSRRHHHTRRINLSRNYLHPPSEINRNRLSTRFSYTVPNQPISGVVD